MKALVPLFATDRNAAKLMDMHTAMFLRLVNDGVLPKPTMIGGCERWDIEKLQMLVRGEAVDGVGEVSW